MEQADLFFYFYKLRFVFASILTIAFLLSISALVAAIGSNTILASGPSADRFESNTSETTNVVAAGGTVLADGTQRMLLSTGSAIYRGCRSVTIATAQSGRSIAHDSAAVVSGIWNGTAFAVRGVGSGIVFMFRTTASADMFMLRLPGRLAGSVASGHTVSAIIRPNEDKSVPVINAKTSAAALANLSAAQQQEIEKLLAAQVVANRGLGGAVVAGDPNHGGYPAKWDNAPQDSQTDSWGMYSRECVSYAAWKVYQTYGDMPYWGGVGNANQWVNDARRAGIPTGTTPLTHSVAISMNGYYGHAMWVEKVSGDMIYVSQYNYDLHGHYSEMWVSSSHLTYIYFK